MKTLDISIIIRTLNESKYLPRLLVSINNQETVYKKEVILIDSGSTDETLSIAKHYGCKILHISRKEFSFGRSLNKGCKNAKGKVLVFVSGHCIPYDKFWLDRLVKPIFEKKVEYTYGKQIGGPETFISEKKIFEKYFPEINKIPQNGFYCNNANSALLTKTWLKYKFDEELTGLEDMFFCKKLTSDGGKVGYVADSCVYHLHHENNKQIKKRFEREAYALQKIYPNLVIRKRDFLRYFFRGSLDDIKFSLDENKFNFDTFRSILSYRFFQYLGSYIGNNIRDSINNKIKDSFYYPSNKINQNKNNKKVTKKKINQSNHHKYNLVALLPMKANSERIPNKNFKEFHHKPLFKWILEKLIKIEKIDLIVINTDARNILDEYEITNNKKILIRDRDENLVGDFVSMNEIIKDDLKKIDSKTYLMTHTTNPLLSTFTIESALFKYYENLEKSNYDSLFSVNELKTRLYRSNCDPLNHNPKKLQRTQDLESLYEENSNFYIFSKQSFSKANARIGKKPYMFVSPYNESIDIDNFEQWSIAEAIISYQEKNNDF